ncbi:MAG TPA: hypothetical protein VFE24_08825 [Pirellulales bacterium]|jgi:hypothetical protein|nr:hypothetical protein [Pirellulales bacterium]
MPEDAPAPDLDPDNQAALQAVVKFAAQRVVQGDSRARLERTLVERGLPADVARELVGDLWAARSGAMRRLGLLHLVVGAGWCIGGSVLTWWTYSAAERGGSYVIAWGAIAFGALEFGWGLWKLVTARRS